MSAQTKIFFHAAHSFSLQNIIDIKNFIEERLKLEKRPIEEIHFFCMNNEEIRTMNQKFLSHDYPTDVITLVYNANPILADVFLGGGIIKENAKTYQVSVQNEFLRVIFHSILHIIGYNDKTQEEKAIMRQQENSWMAAFHVKQKGGYNP